MKIRAILHNRHDPASRALVEQLAGAKRVIDWYDDESRDAWVSEGGTQAVSTFPCAVREDGVVEVIGIGYAYDRERDEFVPPQWTLVDGVWTAPPVPDAPEREA